MRPIHVSRQMLGCKYENSVLMKKKVKQFNAEKT